VVSPGPFSSVQLVAFRFLKFSIVALLSSTAYDGRSSVSARSESGDRRSSSAAALEDFEMGPAASGVQCGSSQIGGAKSIRLNSQTPAVGMPAVELRPRSQL
jgi:hypothetical protein